MAHKGTQNAYVSCQRVSTKKQGRSGMRFNGSLQIVEATPLPNLLRRRVASAMATPDWIRPFVNAG